MCLNVFILHFYILPGVHFLSLIWPAGSAPAALARLLFDSPEPQIIRKTQWIATFLPFRAPASSFFWLSPSHIFSLLDFSSLTLPTSALPSLHIGGSLTSKLPSTIELQMQMFEEQCLLIQMIFLFYFYILFILMFLWFFHVNVLLWFFYFYLYFFIFLFVFLDLFMFFYFYFNFYCLYFLLFFESFPYFRGNSLNSRADLEFKEFRLLSTMIFQEKNEIQRSFLKIIVEKETND